MIIKTKKRTYIDSTTDEVTLEVIETHIFADHGHFEQDGYRVGWHISSDSDDIVDEYTEVDDGLDREIPELTDDIFYLEPDEEDIITEE